MLQMFQGMEASMLLFFPKKKKCIKRALNVFFSIGHFLCKLITDSKMCHLNTNQAEKLKDS